ncbi:hypothetical protein [Curtobacterium flaccumfaciens]|uniref:hypothetical protein n=1 Tax=Curtobacterium flaccumfaciens TaxID=2035 RepID=UPI0015975684|nr:hypothetical protein [Curtobacterium flaccumfaciens]QKS87164.1 hypothetical protein FK523_06205 [Curtobacterium flaccumfaciens pv. flaccumfaciens]
MTESPTTTALSNYESADGVDPLHVTTYRQVRKAARRGHALPGDAGEPSLADLVNARKNGTAESR